MRELWALDPSVTYLNHGSYGATPRAVLAAQQQWRDRLEADPMAFFHRVFPDALAAARAKLATFVGAAADDLAFVPNATTAVSTVLASLCLSPDDELVIANQGYNACKNALRRTGCKVVFADVPFPIQAREQVVAAFEKAVTPKTKLVLLDHVTSPTALIYPVAEIVKKLKVPVMIDGAHAPGMIPVDIEAIGADYYTANCHKWMCAPKGAAFLWVRRDHQERVRPLVTSHGTGFRAEFDWTGTADPTAYLSVSAAIDLFDWPVHMATNRELVLKARKLLGGEAMAPESMIGSMASITLEGGNGGHNPLELDPLSERLYREYKIEVPVFNVPRRMLRVSAQRYNRLEDYEKLKDSLRLAT